MAETRKKDGAGMVGQAERGEVCQLIVELQWEK
jgi:hypothetical protein